jgi:hypothetical protein
LEAIGTPDPNNATQYFSWWKMRNPYMSPDDAKWFEELGQIARSNPEARQSAPALLGGCFALSVQIPSLHSQRILSAICKTPLVATRIPHTTGRLPSLSKRWRRKIKMLPIV